MVRFRADEPSSWPTWCCATMPANCTDCKFPGHLLTRVARYMGRTKKGTRSGSGHRAGRSSLQRYDLRVYLESAVVTPSNLLVNGYSQDQPEPSGALLPQQDQALVRIQVPRAQRQRAAAAAGGLTVQPEQQGVQLRVI